MGKRLVRWFTYNLVFALAPLGISLLFRSMVNRLTVDELAKSPEVLFFSLIVSATTLGNLKEITNLIEDDIKLRVIESVLLLGAVSSSIFYGALLYSNIVAPSLEFQTGLLKISIILAVGLFVLSTIVEAFIGRLADKVKDEEVKALKDKIEALSSEASPQESLAIETRVGNK